MGFWIFLHVVLLLDSEACFGNETWLLVLLKSCTVTLKNTRPAHFRYCATGAGDKRAVIGYDQPSIRRASAFHWWNPRCRLWLSRYCCTKMAAELVEAMASRAWIALIWWETDAGVWGDNQSGCGVSRGFAWTSLRICTVIKVPFRIHDETN